MQGETDHDIEYWGSEHHKKFEKPEPPSPGGGTRRSSAPAPPYGTPAEEDFGTQPPPRDRPKFVPA